MSVLKTGAWLVLVTVQVNVSVSVSVPSVTVIDDVVDARAPKLRVPLMTPVLAADGHAVGQAGGAVGERVEIGIGRVGVESTTLSPSASSSGR